MMRRPILFMSALLWAAILVYSGGLHAKPKALTKVPGKGKDLVATFKTSHGKIACRLHHKRAPKTVANFVGLALGLKSSSRVRGETATKQRFYDGLTFHRVLPTFLIQGGCPDGTGKGGPGFRVRDEISPALNHDQPGVLSMANTKPDRGGSQFFITERAAPWLDGKHSVFGRCRDLKTVRRIARVPVGANQKPRADVVIEQVEVRWTTF